MGGLTTRVLSALAALLLLAGVTYWGGTQGLAILARVVIVIGIFEFIPMAFAKPEIPKSMRSLFFISAILTFLGIFSYTSFGFLILAATSSLFIAGGLWICRDKTPNQLLLSTLSLGVIGLLYFVSFPVLAVKTLLMNHGPIWFSFLLIVVFFGDTFAYFGGRFF